MTEVIIDRDPGDEIDTFEATDSTPYEGEDPAVAQGVALLDRASAAPHAAEIRELYERTNRLASAVGQLTSRLVALEGELEARLARLELPPS